MTLVSYQKIPSDIAATANPTWPIGRTERGWMICASFFEYVANILEPHILNVPKPVILFLDNHSSHVSLQLSEFCQEKGIILVALSLNSTHILQPLDVSFFKPLKSNWNKELEMFKLKNNAEPRKSHVLPIIESILYKDSFKTNLENGFKACSLRDLDPNIVDYTKCLKHDDVEPEKQPNCREICGNVEGDILLKQFEKRLPIFLKKKFNEAGINDVWSRNERFAALFDFYKAIKFNLNFEDLGTKMPDPSENGTDYEFPYSNIDINNMDAGKELDLNLPIIYTDSDSLATCPGYAENLPNENFDQGTQLLILIPTNVPTTSVACINNMVNDDNVLDLGVAVQPTSNMTSPIVGNSTIPSSVSSVGLSSSSSSSSGKSVTDILDSIVTFKHKKSHEENERKARRKLHLPSVMTSADWIALKRALNQEKEEAEKKKEERMKARKAKQEELAARKKTLAESTQTRQKLKPETHKLKCRSLKLTQPASRKQKKSESTVTNSIPSVIENPTQIEIGSWVVVEYLVPNSAARLFIANIFKASNGHLFGKFLRPKRTRHHDGYVFTYPLVKDVAKVPFHQIKKILPPPTTYGRGFIKILHSHEEFVN